MVAARRGERTALTGPEANALVHHERAEVDAIADRVGDAARRRSAPDRARRVSRPAARARRLRPPTAHAADGAAVLDARRRAGDRRQHGARATSPSGRRRVRGARGCWRAGRARRGSRTDGSGEAPPRRSSAARSAVSRAGSVMSLVVEGGPVLHGAFWRAGLVDRVELFVSPGADRRRTASSGRALPDGSIASLAELTATTGRRRRADRRVCSRASSAFRFRVRRHVHRAR